MPPNYQFRFLKTRVPVLVAPALRAGGNLPEAPTLLIVPITPFLSVAFFVLAFLTTVVPVLEALDWLASLALPFPVLGAVVVAAALLPLPTPAEAVVSFLETPLFVLGFSNSSVRYPAAGFRGEIGLARKDFPGDIVGRIGDRGSVREFGDLGESI
jgi:hypothetical protein